MTWLNPWAFAGLLALAVPIFVHLITRRRTRVQAFPTLRFITASRLLPVRTLRPSDPLLLAVRCAVSAAAVFALAQPQVRSAERERAASGALARVIIVDTSASMRRATPAGGSALDAARREAARAAGEAAVSVNVETAAPAGELRGASEWLRYQPGRRAIIVISDFQTGALAERDLVAVPPDVGLDFTRVALRTDADVAAIERLGDVEIAVRAELAGGSTDATWSVRRTGVETSPAVLMLAGEDESDIAQATLAAAQLFAAPPADTARAIAIVFPGHSRRAELERTTQPTDAAWMGNVAASVWRDGRSPRIGRAAVDGRERLLLFAAVEPGTIEAAALTVAAANALADRMPAAEREPTTVAAAQLDTWRREPGAVVIPGDDTGTSDGRWLWLLALALLGAETLLRRPRALEREIAAGEEPHERVA